MQQNDSTLPEYASPPVSEVVLGMQFNRVDGFLAPHLGLIWDKFRGNYPRVEEHPPLSPTFEIFGPGALVGAFGTGFQLVGVLGMPRVFFISQEGNDLFQLQADRFIHNWRKINDRDVYPRFESVFAQFDRGLEDFLDAMAAAGLGPVVPNQCEISYINHLPLTDSSDAGGLAAQLFEGFPARLSLEGVGSPEDTRFLMRYALPNGDGAPIGRLIVTVEPARRMDGQSVMQLSLTARGQPLTPNIDGVRQFIHLGRKLIVRGFTELTTPEMHALWERTR